MRWRILFFFLVVVLQGKAQNVQVPFTENDLFKQPAAETSGHRGFQEVTIGDTAGSTIHGLVAMKRKEAPLILYFHGNGESLWSKGVQRKLRCFKRAGFSVLAIDYPGYGKSTGVQEMKNMEAVASRTLRFAQTNYPNKKHIFWGYSLGSIAAFQLSSRHSSKALVVEGSISNLPSMERDLELAYSIPGRLVDLIVPEQPMAFDNLETSQTSHAEFAIFLHGDRDQLANRGYARGMYNEMKVETKYWIPLKDAGHNYSFKMVRWYLRAIKGYLAN